MPSALGRFANHSFLVAMKVSKNDFSTFSALTITFKMFVSIFFDNEKWPF
jgi:hypothetical protein